MLYCIIFIIWTYLQMEDMHSGPYESDINLEVVFYKDRLWYECLVNWVTVWIKDGNYTDEAWNQHKIEWWDDIIREYHEQKISDVIHSYDENTWYYKWTVNWQSVYVDKSGNYTDSEWNAQQVDDWEYIMNKWKTHKIWQVKRKTTPAIVDTMTEIRDPKDPNMDELYRFDPDVENYWDR